MPALFREAILLLFRNDPQLAPKLLRDALGVTLPHYTDEKVYSAELAEAAGDDYQRNFTKRFYDSRGRSEIITRLLIARFGLLSNEVQFQLAWSSTEELNVIADRLLTATSLQEALAPKS